MAEPLPSDPPQPIPPASSEDGYAKAFYEIADMLGIAAQADSPQHVWENVMRPRILARLRPAVVGDYGEFVIRVPINEHGQRVYGSGVKRGIEYPAVSATPSASAGVRLTGRQVQQAFADTFNGGGWADSPSWDDFDDDQKAHYDLAAERILALIAPAQTLGGQPEGER